MTYWIDRILNRENPFEGLIHTISQFASEPIELDPYCQLILEQLADVFQPRSAGLFLKQKAAGRFHLVARLGLSIGDMQLDLNHPLPVYFVRHAHLLHTSDLEIFPQFRALWAEERQLLEKLESVLFVPLKAGGELVGILSIGGKHSGQPYTAYEKRQLELLGSQAALVIRMKYSATAETRWRQEAESMQRAISEITNDCDLEEALLRNLNLLHDTLAYDTAYISLLEDDQLVVKSAQGYTHPEKIIGRADPVEGNLIIQSIFENRQALLVEDTHLDQRFHEMAGPPVLRNWLGVPLINHGEILGMLVLNGRKAKMFQVNPARLEMVQAFANQAAVLVEKSRMFQIERRQHHLANALNNLGIEVESLNDINLVYDLLLDRVGRAVPADITMLFLVKGHQFELERTCASPELDPTLRESALSPAHELSAYANLQYLMNARRALVISDTEKDPDWVLGPLAERSWAGVPVILEGEVVACFTFSSLQVNQYRPENVEVLGIIAVQAGLALQNFRLLNEVRQMATYDELTGLINRRQFLDLGEREFRRARRFHHQLSVMLIDVDQFIKVNEAYGQEAGDQVLRGVADLIKANVRNVDIPGRYHAEEFAIILTETDQPGAEILSERIRELIDISPNITTAGLVKITVSIGVAIMGPETLSWDILLERATNALADAKRTGRNRIVVYTDQSQGV